MKEKENTSRVKVDEISSNCNVAKWEETPVSHRERIVGDATECCALLDLVSRRPIVMYRLALVGSGL